jgi:hypothetical protein
VNDDRKTTEAALDTALERVRDAEARFVETPVGTGESVELAFDVEQRAEDVEELAATARDQSDDIG